MMINQLPAIHANTIIQGDALSVMRTMPDGCVDIVITSPPYNMAIRSKQSQFWPSWRIADGYDGYLDAMPEPEYVQWQRECLTEMLRLVPETGAVFYNHKWRIQHGHLNDRRDILDGFPHRQTIIWRRGSGVNFNRSFFLPTYEVIYLLAKSRFRLMPGGNKHTDVWAIQPDAHNRHPAPFPVAIPERILTATGAKTVLDPFIGSGTTAVAAIQLGRVFVGVEQSPLYCRQARERVYHARRILAGGAR